ncbi:hypothetical protein [Pengzhenrongella phosphoraccumulans]|uniref:hypothetical protein n=1 Tax=Pengzhenrongella phosphoraccumulans TaxID=3114394 RepID=UPI00388ED4FF
MNNKIQHMQFIQAVIARMAANSFQFKGWSITIAAGLAAFAAIESRTALLVMVLVSTVLFWGLDGYYLWLERCFVALYNAVAAMTEDQVDFSMKPDKTGAALAWVRTCFRPHLAIFYGAIIVIDVAGLILTKTK